MAKLLADEITKIPQIKISRKSKQMLYLHILIQKLSHYYKIYIVFMFGMKSRQKFAG